MEKKKRLMPEQKTIIPHEFLENQVLISQIAEKYGIHPNDIYNWKKLLFGAGSEIFSHKSRTSETKSEVRTKKVEDKLLQKDKLIAEIFQENIIFKKT